MKMTLARPRLDATNASLAHPAEDDLLRAAFRFHFFADQAADGFRSRS